MKRFVALCLLSVSTVSFAAERSIYDLMYLPKAGTTYGQTDFNLLKEEVKINGGGKIDVSGYQFEQTIGHSISDRLLLNARLDWVNVEIDPKGGTKSTVEGLSDPSIGARFRAVDEALMVDVIGDFTVGLGDREVDGDETNNRQGGHSLKVGAEVGQKHEGFQWAGHAFLNRNFKAKTKTTGGGGTVEDDAYNGYVFGGSVLQKLAEETYLLGMADVNFDNEYDNDANGTTASSTRYDLSAGVRQLFSPDLMLQVALMYSTTNQDSATFEDQTAWTLNAGLRYQF